MNRIINKDCIEGLKELESQSVDTCVTSPPYFGLRDYGHEGQIGLEETPEHYVDKMVEVFEQVRRVLKPQGTLWCNLGDSYASNSKGSGGPSAKQTSNAGSRYEIRKFNHGVKEKDLMGIPWLVAFALRSAGWYLRQDIIWHKPNPMPESVTDRCTKAHEYIFLLSKSSKYYYDHEAVKIDALTFENRPAGVVRNRLYNYDSKENNNPEAYLRQKLNNRIDLNGTDGFRDTGIVRCGDPMDGKANKRSVWTVTTKPFSAAHFATFPEDLIVDCIKAGCPENGTVLDPFMGAGTTALVARKLNRNYIGFELNKEYIKIAEKRLRDELGMFI
jgi:DNA modification methylase